MTMDRGQRNRIATGARCKFSIQGKVIGYARNVSATEEIEYQPIEVLDNIRVEEHVAVAYRVRLTASFFRIVGDSLKSMGFFPPNGGDTSTHMENILLSGEMNAQIEDTKTGKIITQAHQVKVASHNWTVDAKGVVGEDMEFVAISITDESEIA